jgi:hypothetical protein
VRSLSGALIVVVVTALTSSVSAAELGRLFFSPAERAALEQARRAQGDDETTLEGLGEVVEVPSGGAEMEVAASERIRVNGYVSRSGGPETVWLNGLDSHQGNLAEIGIDANRIRLEGARVRVPAGIEAGGVLLKPGQSFDPASGDVLDAYERDRSPLDGGFEVQN